MSHIRNDFWIDLAGGAYLKDIYKTLSQPRIDDVAINGFDVVFL
jgi:hypothetical protein